MASGRAAVTVMAYANVRIHQISTPALGDQSYLVASQGEAAIVDPQRDIDRYLAAIDHLAVRVVAVAETHVHNDYVSGGPALARRLGCPYVVPAGAGYTLARREVGEGDEIPVGGAILRALFTPGHTPHHLSYQVVRAGRVEAILTGGCVLVGACGRTDLIDPDQTEWLTHLQFRSARRIGTAPDPTVLGPTHGAGSFCAAPGTSEETWTTVGEEKLRNPAFLAPDEERFVRRQMDGFGAYPAYYQRMAAINREGEEGWVPVAPRPLGPAEADRLRREGARVVDARPRRVFAPRHIPGSINVELDDEFGTYLGWLWPAGTRFVLVLAADQDPIEPSRQAARVGIETIEGVLDGGIDAWQRAGMPVAAYGVASVEELHDALAPDREERRPRALDVRQDAEWAEGRVPGAIHIHIADLPGRTAEVEPPAGDDAPVYVYCRSGRRASMGASLLDAAGVRAILVDGGFPDWQERGYPVEVD